MRRGFFEAVLVAAFASGGVGRAVAEDTSPPAAEPEPKPAAIPWVDGWKAGRAAAAASGKLAFVFVRGVEAPCDKSVEMEQGPLAEPECAKIGERAIPVRIDVATLPTNEHREFMLRYGITALPSILILDAEGHMVLNSMRNNGPGFLSALDRAETAEKEYLETKAKTDEDNRAWMRELLGQRLAWDELIPMQEADVAAAPTPDTYSELARLYQRACRRDAERRALTTAVELFPTDGSRTKWRMRLATMECDLIAAPVEQSEKIIDDLLVLAKALAQEHDPAGEAQARIVVAHSLAKLRRFDDAIPQYEYVVKLSPGTTTAPAALLGEAAVAWAKYDYEGCKALCQRIIKDYTMSEEAKAARGTLRNCELKLKPN